MTMKRQGGWTIWSLLGVGLLIALSAMLVMKLFPPYFDNMKLQEALEKIADDPRVVAWDKRQIVLELDNMLYIDYGHEIVDLKKALSVDKSKTDMTLAIDYEVVVHLAYNISALLDFNNAVSIPLR